MGEETVGQVDGAYGQGERRDAFDSGRQTSGDSPRKELPRGSRGGDSGRNLWNELYRIAGFLGVDPGPFSYRELSWMASGKLEQQWWHTAHLISLHVNMNRKKGSRVRKAEEFHPFMRKRRVSRTTGSIDWLKVLLPEGDPDRESLEHARPATR